MPGRGNNSNKSNQNDAKHAATNDITESSAMLQIFFDQQKEITSLMESKLNEKMLRREESLLKHVDTLETKLFNMETRLEAIEKQAINSDKRALEAEQKVITLETQLETAYYDIDELEMGQRRSCIVVNNLPSDNSNSDENVFITMCEDKLLLKDGRKITKATLNDYQI